MEKKINKTSPTKNFKSPINKLSKDESVFADDRELCCTFTCLCVVEINLIIRRHCNTSFSKL